MKKIISIMLLSFFVFPLPAVARKSPTATATATAVPLRFQLKNKMQLRLNAGQIVEGVVKAIDGQTLSVEKDGTAYKVNTTASTKFRRRFWGAGKLTEVSVGDKVSVYGVWVDDAKTEMDARLIRDLSIQKRFGAFFGEVKTIGSDSLVMITANRGDQTVTISADTKLVNRKMETITISDILVGHKIRVKGLWNNTANTITEVKQIKDFSIPILTPTP